MLSRWTAAAGYSCLMVALYVAEPAIVSLTVHDHVQLDRVTGTSAERHGALLPPGTTPVHLAAGTYVFRTTSDAQVQLGDGTPARVLAVTQSNDKRAQWRTGVFTLDAYAGLAAWGRAASLTTVPALAPAWLTAGSTLIRGTGQVGDCADLQACRI